jgi:hypothetical protein
LEGVERNRIVHIPTHSLYPTAEWQTGQIVEERFEIELPAEIPSGSYVLLTAWYDGANPYAAETDSRSRIGQEQQVGTLTLP